MYALIVFLICLVLMLFSFAAWRSRDVRDECNDTAQRKIAPSLYDHWHARVSWRTALIQQELDRLNKQGSYPSLTRSLVFLRDNLDSSYSGGEKYWPWENNKRAARFYLETVDEYVSTGDDSLIPIIEKAAEPLLESYDEIYYSGSKTPG